MDSISAEERDNSKLGARTHIQRTDTHKCIHTNPYTHSHKYTHTHRHTYTLSGTNFYGEGVIKAALIWPPVLVSVPYKWLPSIAVSIPYTASEPIYPRCICRYVCKAVAKSNFFARPSVGLAARMKQLSLHHIDFRHNLYIPILLKFDSHSKFWLKFDKKTDTFYKDLRTLTASLDTNITTVWYLTVSYNY
jgi:hypothetical protein